VNGDAVSKLSLRMHAQGFMSVKEAAAKIGVSIDTIYRLVRGEKVQFITVGSVKWVERASLANYYRQIDPRAPRAGSSSAVSQSAVGHNSEWIAEPYSYELHRKDLWVGRCEGCHAYFIRPLDRKDEKCMLLTQDYNAAFPIPVCLGRVVEVPNQAVVLAARRLGGNLVMKDLCEQLFNQTTSDPDSICPTCQTPLVPEHAHCKCLGLWIP